MIDDFVVHPDGTVDYPPTGCYTMSPEEFSGLDTRLAWSAVEPKPYFNEPPHHGWGSTIKVAAAAAGAVLVAIVVAAVVLHPPGHASPSPTTQTVTATPTPTREADPGPPPGPFVMPPDVQAAHLTQDGDYFHRLMVANDWSSIDDPAQALKFAHAMCEDLARGFTAPELATGEYIRFHQYPVETYRQEIEIAAAVYCPEQG